MEVFKYIPEVHRPLIDEWSKDRIEVHAPPPEIGYVAYAGKEPIAAIFLLRAESKTCIIDGLIANPKIKNPVRANAIYIIVDRLINDAKALGFETIIAWTSNASTFEKAMNFGFKPLIGEIVIAKDLR